MQLDQHPTVKKFRQQAPSTGTTHPLDASALHELCLRAGADDVGFVALDRPEIADQKPDILTLFPSTKTLISLVRRMNPTNVQSPARSIANVEFHHTTDDVNDIALQIVAELAKLGVPAMVGGAAGLSDGNGSLGHEKLGGLSQTHRRSGWPGTHGHPSQRDSSQVRQLHPAGNRPGGCSSTNHVCTLDYYNPCLECKLCVAACPTGAISSDGQFDFSACYTHNYREFMGGFTDWVENVVNSRNARDYRQKVSDPETVSLWQSLSFGANYKAAYCMAVCPAGEDVIAPFLTERKAYLDNVVRPLQNKSETVYVLPGSDAEAYVARRFQTKKTKRVSNGLRPPTVAAFLRGLLFTFQKGQSAGLDAVYHFTFTGAEQRQATVTIRNQSLNVQDGHTGKANFNLKADARTWLRFLAKETNLITALLRGKIRFKGNPRLLLAFARCFPS